MNEEKAYDLVDILKMWGLTKIEALSIATRMVAIIRDSTEWKSPLEGTGLTVPGHPGYKDPDKHGH